MGTGQVNPVFEFGVYLTCPQFTPLKLVTSDEANSLGSMEHPLELPAMPESGMGGSSLVIADELARLPDLIKDLQAKLQDDSEPLIFSGMRIFPSVENKLALNSPLLVFFRLYGVGASRNLVANVKLMHESGNLFSKPPIALDNDLVAWDGDEAIVGLNLPFEDVIPGKYRPVIETSEPGSSQSATVQTELELATK